jgi:hypothetical protein
MYVWQWGSADAAACNFWRVKSFCMALSGIMCSDASVCEGRKVHAIKESSSCKQQLAWLPGQDTCHGQHQEYADLLVFRY